MNVKFKNSSTGDKIFIVSVYAILSIILVIVLYPLIYVGSVAGGCNTERLSGCI